VKDKVNWYIPGATPFFHDYLRLWGKGMEFSVKDKVNWYIPGATPFFHDYLRLWGKGMEFVWVTAY